MEPARFDPLRETVWGLNAEGRWEGTYEGFLITVEPPYEGAPLRDHRCVEYAEGRTRLVAAAWADASARDRGGPPCIGVRAVGLLEFSAHNPRGAGADSRYRHREGHAFHDMPRAVRDQLLADDPGIRWIRRSAFQYWAYGFPRGVEAAFEAFLFAVLSQAIREYARLNRTGDAVRASARPTPSP